VVVDLTNAFQSADHFLGHLLLIIRSDNAGERYATAVIPALKIAPGKLGMIAKSRFKALIQRRFGR
jgi:hypothetical protein